jgi:hypothetical protein
MEVHLDSASGRKIADLAFSGSDARATADGKGFVQTIVAPLQAVNDGGWHNLYIVGTKKDPEAQDVPVASWYIRLLNR